MIFFLFTSAREKNYHKLPESRGHIRCTKGFYRTMRPATCCIFMNWLRTLDGRKYWFVWRLGVIRSFWRHQRKTLPCTLLLHSCHQPYRYNCLVCFLSHHCWPRTTSADNTTLYFILFFWVTEHRELGKHLHLTSLVIRSVKGTVCVGCWSFWSYCQVFLFYFFFSLLSFLFVRSDWKEGTIAAPLRTLFKREIPCVFEKG